MIVVKFKQEEADFLFNEFGIKVDSKLQLTLTSAQARDVQEKCIDIEIDGISIDGSGVKSTFYR